MQATSPTLLCRMPPQHRLHEKLFTIEQSLNRQNNRIIASSIREANSRGRIVGRTSNPAHVMVWASITSDGKSPLVFVPQNVKLNAKIYKEDILEKVLLPWARNHFGCRQWTFQQDGAPAHRANVVQQWCRTQIPDKLPLPNGLRIAPTLTPLTIPFGRCWSPRHVLLLTEVSLILNNRYRKLGQK
ncbi:unnamed protein product [Nippostrongylus brasiliensis]|uniref:DDE_3 domain-containing protein n=1 Tax=Nippostrongylus brasiliensis TaxID=27835 RepID=A0A0N4Y1S4_NIPBR|nr:unnamed protein product [Nippostrongylus brasiliensis]